MKVLRAASVLLLAGLSLTACDDDATSVEIADLAGFWTATSFAYTDASIPTLSADAVALGGTVTMDVQADGSFSGNIDIPNLTPGSLPIGGTISILDSETLRVDFDATTEAYNLFGDFDATFDLDGDDLDITSNTTFDFPDDIETALGLGARGPVDAILTADFQR
jgi:hypothetical protein